MQQSLNIRKFTGFAFLASILNTIIYFIATSADATMEVAFGDTSQEISFIMIFGVTQFSLVAAAYVVPRIGKKIEGFVSKSPLIGLVFGVVSAVAPFTAADDTKTAVALASNHIVAGVLWYVGTKRSIK
ncbi:MAG: hypothetical protein ABR64_04955 [Actinobacteria bacterium BACL2 MAG-121001-bin67]|jgi:hypothetical protein|uniref:Uncharacterized protein n=1 Tax=Actinobacteria bacterium BACL2 MAG-121001-bin67 TaxID=1655572 RepID=A0A0R2P159_9ACTN|nr:MAG: hypothetical protein ABR64_04955 [Actinobacteria bacterium BACL2 MAG-121001-bin67]KRO73521.1 MAG: hypothetical protein ABS00_06095 [Actinobacteria bacterium BACL2 MAG-120920-bin34]